MLNVLRYCPFEDKVFFIIFYKILIVIQIQSECCNNQLYCSDYVTLS